jgi:Protein of unknown function (DUF3558)
MTTLSIRQYVSFVAAGAGLCLLSLTACSGSSSATASGGAAAAGGTSSAAAGTASAAAATAAGSAGKTADPCTLVTAAELSQAVGVQYTAVTDPGGNICGVKGPGSASFDYTVQKESATNTWTEQVATIKGDDGQAVSEPGIGDRAVWGGEEFAAEADGYIVGVIGADFPSTAQGSGFVRTGKIAKLLISKL